MTHQDFDVANCRLKTGKHWIIVCYENTNMLKENSVETFMVVKVSGMANVLPLAFKVEFNF